MDSRHPKRRLALVIAVQLGLALVLFGCQGGSGSGGGSGMPLFAQGLPTIVLRPSSSLEAPIALAEGASLTITASENGYGGAFSAVVVNGSCITVAAVAGSSPTNTFTVTAQHSTCPIASIRVSDTNGHTAVDYFSVH